MSRTQARPGSGDGEAGTDSRALRSRARQDAASSWSRAVQGGGCSARLPGPEPAGRARAPEAERDPGGEPQGRTQEPKDGRPGRRRPFLRATASSEPLGPQRPQGLLRGSSGGFGICGRGCVDGGRAGGWGVRRTGRNKGRSGEGPREDADSGSEGSGIASGPEAPGSFQVPVGRHERGEPGRRETRGQLRAPQVAASPAARDRNDVSGRTDLILAGSRAHPAPSGLPVDNPRGANADP